MNFFDGQILVQGAMFPKHDAMYEGQALYYGIQYNHSGRFLFQMDRGKIYHAEGPHAFFTLPGHFYRYGSPPGESRSHNFICSEGERCLRYLEAGLYTSPRSSPLIPVREPEKFLATLSEILAWRLKPGLIAPRAILLYEDLLLQLYESVQEESHLLIWQEHFFKELIQAIRKSPALEWDFAREARRCNITETHFRRLFKVMTGQPPQKFLIQERLLLAQMLLLEQTHMSIEEIAAACGIENVYYFSRLFRSRYHVSPLRFRRSLMGYSVPHKS